MQCMAKKGIGNCKKCEGLIRWIETPDGWRPCDFGIKAREDVGPNIRLLDARSGQPCDRGLRHHFDTCKANRGTR